MLDWDKIGRANRLWGNDTVVRLMRFADWEKWVSNDTVVILDRGEMAWENIVSGMSGRVGSGHCMHSGDEHGDEDKPKGIDMWSDEHRTKLES
jgi:hypothetical protein